MREYFRTLYSIRVYRVAPTRALRIEKINTTFNIDERRESPHSVDLDSAMHQDDPLEAEDLRSGGLTFDNLANLFILDLFAARSAHQLPFVLISGMRLDL